METNEDAIAFRNLTKSYGGNVVLDRASLSVAAGEIHALLGPNGAGKSTLLGCLSGAVQPDSGTIECAGQVFDSLKPSTAFESGIATIYQTFQLIDDLSVSDNIFLGGEVTKAHFLTDRIGQADRTRAILNRLGVDLSPHRMVSSLSIGERQLVEIAKALRHNPTVLILDEPTSALSQSEVSALLDLVRRLAEELNIAIIYVTHLLHEVLDVADAVTVLRDGQVAWTKDISAVDMDLLVSAISPETDANSEKRPAVTRDANPVLSITELSTGYTGPITTTIHEREIIGVFGLLGSGRSDLLESLCGVRSLQQGCMVLGDRPYAPTSVRSALARGIALVPSNRVTMSLFGPLSALDNVLLPRWSRTTRHRVRSKANEERAFEAIAANVQLRPPDPQQPAESFSGGNAQKLVVGRWLNDLAPLSILVLDEPTQGIDIGSRLELYKLLRAFVDAQPGRAVIFASSDPEEIELLATRILVLSEGQVVGEVDPGGGEESLLAMVHSRVN